MLSEGLRIFIDQHARQSAVELLPAVFSHEMGIFSERAVTLASLKRTLMSHALTKKAALQEGSLQRGVKGLKMLTEGGRACSGRYMETLSKASCLISLGVLVHHRGSSSC